MSPAIEQMLSGYECRTAADYENALKEIIQEVSLLGLWRSKFFEHAAFYGGSALRILYGLERFSEDLDFSLLRADDEFRLSAYLQAVRSELEGFGFDVSVDMKVKKVETPIESAFIKAGTRLHLLKIAIPSGVPDSVHRNRAMTIKLEVDTDPPHGFHTEAKVLLQPIPFSVLTYCLPDLFAGKLHAILQRSWQTRVKGRDFFDFVWYVGRGVPCHLSHLEARLRQSGGWVEERPMGRGDLISRLQARFELLDVEAACQDVSPFLKDPAMLALWSRDFFVSLLAKLLTE